MKTFFMIMLTILGFFAILMLCALCLDIFINTMKDVVCTYKAIKHACQEQKEMEELRNRIRSSMFGMIISGSTVMRTP